MKTKPFRQLRQQMSPERRSQNEARMQTTLIHMALQELRQTLNLTQQDLADKLELSQPSLSKLEHQHDIQVSTLAGYIEALGGQLKLVASFPDQEVVISQFDKRR
jgi:transcriptional regulator with XRE-family HTH domain